MDSPTPQSDDDYDTWETNFGQQQNALSSIQVSVPEPTTVALVLVGLLSVLAPRAFIADRQEG